MHCHICLQTHVCTGMTTTLYNLCSGIEALAFSGYVALLWDPIQILFFRKYVPYIEIPLTSASIDSYGPISSQVTIRSPTIVHIDCDSRRFWTQDKLNNFKTDNYKKKINPSDTVQFIPGYPI